MSLYPLLTEKQTFFDANSNELTGGKLFIYEANSTTKVTTYAETDGLSANSNPIILNSRGEVPNGMYVTGAVQYKLVLAPATDTDPPTSPIWTRDDLTPLGYVAQSALSEWVSSGAAATQTGAATFTTPGDQRTVFQVGRRVRATVTAAPQVTYGTVSAASFAAGSTTVTLSPLSVSLDAGLTGTVPDVGFLTATDPSVPVLPDNIFQVSDSADRSKKYALELGNLTTATTRTRTVVNKSGEEWLPQDAQSPHNVSLYCIASSNTLVIQLKTAAGIDPSAGDPAYVVFRSGTVSSGVNTIVKVTGAVSLTVPQGATLGFTSSEAARVHVYALNNAGAVELVAYRAQSGATVIPLDECGVVSTTAMTTGSDSAQVPYSTSARSNVAVAYVGYFEVATGATPGDWSANPTVITSNRPGLPRPGQIVQRVYASTSAVTTFGSGGGETIPLDNTIPQNTEGVQILSQAILPRSGVNVIRVDVLSYMTVNSAVHVIQSLFNAAGNAIAAMTVLQGNANAAAFPLTYAAKLQTASSTTYSVRAGPATAATVTLNGQGGAGLFGGVYISGMDIIETWA